MLLGGLIGGTLRALRWSKENLEGRLRERELAQGDPGDHPVDPARATGEEAGASAEAAARAVEGGKAARP